MQYNETTLMKINALANRQAGVNTLFFWIRYSFSEHLIIVSSASVRSVHAMKGKPQNHYIFGISDKNVRWKLLLQ